MQTEGCFTAAETHGRSSEQPPQAATRNAMEDWPHPVLGSMAAAPVVRGSSRPANPVLPAATAPPLMVRKSRKSGGRSLETCSRISNSVKGNNVKVEPKTFFANERTFLAWLSIAVLLLFTGLALMDGSSYQGTLPGTVVHLNRPGGAPSPMEVVEEAPMNTSSVREVTRRSVNRLSRQIPGLVIVPLSLVFMVYALVQYRYRTKKLLSRDRMRYDDQWGPLLLVIFLITASLTAFMLLLQSMFN